MLFFLFLSTLLILLFASATARPLSLSSLNSSDEDYRTSRRATSSPPPAAHVPSQPYHSDPAAPGRKSSSPLDSSGTIDTTHRYFKRFIMDADYAAGSSSSTFRGKSSRKRADSIYDLTGSTAVDYKDFHEEFPPKLPSMSPSA